MRKLSVQECFDVAERTLSEAEIDELLSASREIQVAERLVFFGTISPEEYFAISREKKTILFEKLSEANGCAQSATVAEIFQKDMDATIAALGRGESLADVKSQSEQFTAQAAQEYAQERRCHLIPDEECGEPVLICYCDERPQEA